MLSAVNVGFYNKLKLWPETWVAATTYAVGDIMKPTSYTSSTPAEGSRHSYKCTTAGTSAASVEPTWGTTNGGTTADGTGNLVWTCFDGKTYQIKAKQSSTVPYVTFGEETDVPMGTFHDPFQLERLNYWVNCFSDKSPDDIAEIADEVMTALDNVTLTVTNYTSMECIREFIGTVIWDMETGIYMVPLRYRVWLNKT